MNNDVNDLQNTKEAKSEQEIDLLEVVRKLFKERKTIFKACGIAAVIGLIIGFSLPKEFTTEVQLAPEMSEVTSGGGTLGGLAAMAGFNINASAGSDAYSPDLYPDIVESTPFLLELLPLMVKTMDGKEYTVYEYLNEHQKSAWWSYILGFPRMAMEWGRGLFSSEKLLEESEDTTASPIYVLSLKQDRVLNKLRNRISVHVDKKTFVITIAVEMQDAIVSALLTQEVLERLQNYIINYRTQKAKQDLEFTQMAYEEAQERYFLIQRAYAAFEDANKHISTATYRTEQERLKNEMTLAYSLYNSLAQQREQDRLRVQDKTPVFALIEPTKVPLGPSSPRKIRILIGITFLVGVLSAGYILLKDVYKSVVNDKKKQEL